MQISEVCKAVKLKHCDCCRGTFSGFSKCTHVLQQVFIVESFVKKLHNPSHRVRILSGIKILKKGGGVLKNFGNEPALFMNLHGISELLLLVTV